jgi:hypothetical protein
MTKKNKEEEAKAPSSRKKNKNLEIIFFLTNF